MATPRFPRDDGDEQPRQRGRVVPMQPEADPVLVQIRVNGVTFGEVDPATLKAKALIELERAMGALPLLRWLSTYAGLDDEEEDAEGLTARDRAERELGEMNLAAVFDLAAEIAAAIGEGIQIPKARRRR